MFNKRTLLTKYTAVSLASLATLLFTVSIAHAQDYTPLAGVPFIENTSNLAATNYITALYRVSITVAALLVVVKIILAGVKYMFSEVVPQKEAAKKDIRNALLGLLIIISAVLILNTINPNLTYLNFLDGTALKVTVDPPKSIGKVQMACTQVGPGNNTFQCGTAISRCVDDIGGQVILQTQKYIVCEQQGSGQGSSGGGGGGF